MLCGLCNLRVPTKDRKQFVSYLVKYIQLERGGHIMTVNIEKILKEFGVVKARRAPWEAMWELVAKFILYRKKGFNAPTGFPDFYQHSDVFDDTAPLSLGQMVSSLVGALWKNGARTFRIVKPDRLKESDSVKEYYDEINRRVHYQMDHPNAGFGTAYQEFMLENGAFGTSGMGVFRGKMGGDNLLMFRALGLKHLWVEEDAQGRVVKVFYEVHLSAFQLVAEYGEVAKTKNVISKIDSNDHTTLFPVLWLLRRRENIEVGAKGNQAMAYQSTHILQTDQVALRDSGFRELPTIITRFYKNEGEEYGRCPGIEAIPSTISLNAFWELLLKSGEKKLDPALWTFDDGSFGGGTIDTSPGALNTLDGSSRIVSGPPIGIIGDPGDPGWATKVIEMLTKQVVQHFFVDRLLDLNNQTRMTLGEAQIRNELRADSLGGIYNRQIQEGLTPIIQRVNSIMIDAHEFGVAEGSDAERLVLAMGRKPLYIPSEVLELIEQGVEVYNIKYVSPAARVLRAEELRGIMNAWQYAVAYNQVAPELLLRLDKDKSMTLVAELSGATDEIRLSDEKFEEALADFREMQTLNAQIQMKQAEAEAAAKVGSANQQNAQAQATQMGAGGEIL